jgi:hypothetical protein
MLRAHVERAVADSSLRMVAEAIGMSPNAVRNFIRGAEPRTRTRARIERWVAGRPAEGQGAGVAAFTRLIAEATPELPPRDASVIGRELAQAISEAYQRHRLPPPRWVRELTRHYGPRTD